MDNEGQALRDYSNRKKRLKRRRNIVISTLLLLVAVVGTAYLFRLLNRNYQSYEVVKAIDNTGENKAGYLSYGSSVVKYSRDGAVAYDKDGSLIWNGSYEMKEPIADTCGKYVVVADRGGKEVQIFNGKGSAGNFTTVYNILKVEVASQGVVAALMENGEEDYIYLYDVDGTELVHKKTNVNDEGYSMDISLSNNGEKLVISYLSVTKGELISTVAFYNFGEVGQNYTDGFVGGYAFKGEIVPRVVFVNNDTACAYKDNGFLIYAIKETSDMVHEELFEDSKIQSILYNDKYIGIILEAGEAEPKKLLLYDLLGNRVLEKKLEFDYSKIFLTDKEIIMYDNLSCIILKFNGREKFRYTFDSNIEAFYPINDLDRYYFINGSKISKILLVE